MIRVTLEFVSLSLDFIFAQDDKAPSDPESKHRTTCAVIELNLSSLILQIHIYQPVIAS